MGKSESLLTGLNPEQRAAVIHRGGPLLVLAGAGSGKTRVVTVRIAHLVATGERPDRILALTFTNKAAGEMRERLGTLLSRETVRQITLGTFHRLGLKIIHEEARHMGLRRPVALLDAGDQTVAIRHCLKSLGMDPRRHDPQGLLSLVSRARNAAETPETVAAQEGGELVSRVYGAYLEWMTAHEAVDFDDLILRPVALLRSNQEVRDRWQGRFRQILVDEYQDTNSMQFELVRLLSEEHRNLCVVGDDDQSIYGWRGACVDNILQFETRFPDAVTLALEQNYRSTGNILGSANALIHHNTGRMDKRLWTAGEDGERVHVVVCKDPSAEASYVAAELARRHREADTPWVEMGVLFRTGGQARPLEEALRLVGIPYRLVGAYNFFERKEIKDVIAYLRLVVNPRDRAAFVRVVNFPQRGMGPRRLASLMDFARRRSLSPWAACARASEVEDLGLAQVAALNKLHSVVEAARRRAAARQSDGNGSLAGLARALCEEVGARAAWIRDPTEGPGGEGRWRSVEFLLRGLGAWETKNRTGSLSDYLQMVALDGRNDEDDAQEDKVALMTIHAAKGLEWPTCFVVGCQEGYLPHQRSLEEDGSVAEERRLFYVSITRARRALYLIRSLVRRTYGGTEPARISRFVRELPEEFIEHVDRSQGGGEVDKNDTKRRFAALLEQVG